MVIPRIAIGDRACAPYRVKVEIGDADRLVSFRLMGRVPGWAFARHFLETSQKLNGAGLYNMLVDTRRLDTASDYRGYQFLARRCSHLFTQTAPARKLAVISPDVDARVRGGVLAEQYFADTMKTFAAIDEALAWLSPDDLD